MHAAIFQGPNNITVEEIKFSNSCYINKKINQKEIILKVNTCAVCGYDARVFKSGHPKVRPPIILGHEICAETLRRITIPNGKIIKAGTRIAICPIIPCLKCQYCINKQYNLCINLKEIGSTVNGGFAEYIKIPKEILRIGGLVPVPDILSDEEAALLEPLSCCLNSLSHIIADPITRRRKGGGVVDENTTLVIIGDGPMGILHLQLSKKLLGIRTIIVVGKIPKRIQKAKSLGADAVVFAKDDHPNDIKSTAEDIYQVTDGIGGANLVVVATSNPRALDLAMKVAGKNCKINIFAGMPKGKKILLDPNWIHYNQISITGSFSSTPLLLQEAAMLASNRRIIDLRKIISHVYKLDKIHEALLATEKYHGLRVVINKF